MKCLVTRLLESIDNNNLPVFGTLTVRCYKINNSNVSQHSFGFCSTEDIVLKIDGDGYFTDNTLSSGFSKILEVNKNTLTYVYFTDGDFNIVIPEAKKVMSFSRNDSGNDAAYSINIDDLIGNTALTTFFMHRSRETTGDLYSLKDALSLNRTNASVRFSGTNIYGDFNKFIEYRISKGQTGKFSWRLNNIILVNGEPNTTTSSDVIAVINSPTSYTMNEIVWNLINGVWTRGE